MPIFYRRDQEIKDLGLKTGVTSNYRSDHKGALYGGRGGRDQEINYLTTNGITGNTKLSDAWVGYGATQGVTGQRFDEVRRKFYEEKSLP